MTKSLSNCKICGYPLPQREGRGRTRVYGGDHCRNIAYIRRREAQDAEHSTMQRDESEEPWEIVTPMPVSKES